MGPQLHPCVLSKLARVPHGRRCLSRLPRGRPYRSVVRPQLHGQGQGRAEGVIWVTVLIAPSCVSQLFAGPVPANRNLNLWRRDRGTCIFHAPLHPCRWCCFMADGETLWFGDFLGPGGLGQPCHGGPPGCGVLSLQCEPDL